MIFFLSLFDFISRQLLVMCSSAGQLCIIQGICCLPIHWHSFLMKQSVIFACTGLPSWVAVGRKSTSYHTIHLAYCVLCRWIEPFFYTLTCVFCYLKHTHKCHIVCIHYRRCFCYISQISLNDAPVLLVCSTLFAVSPPVYLTHCHFLLSAVCFDVSDPGRSVMSARFRLPAGRSYNVRATELERDRQHTQVVCNVLLLDNTVQAFKVSVSTGLPFKYLTVYSK